MVVVIDWYIGRPVQDDICGISISVRHQDNVVYVWNRSARGETSKILEKVRDLLPNTTITLSFYKASQAHDAFGKYVVVLLINCNGVDSTRFASVSYD
jgi:hypothetical protein